VVQPSELRDRRRDLGLTQVALARALGVSANTVARWERGELRIAQPQLVGLALAGLQARAPGDEIAEAMRLAEAAERAMFSPAQDAWLQRIAEATPKLRDALRRCVERNDIERGMWLAGTLWPRWYQTEAMAEGRAWLDEFLSRDTARAPTRSRAQALYAAAILASHQADWEGARAHAAESLAIWRALGEPKRIAMLLNVLAIQHRHAGAIDESLRLFAEGIAVARESRERAVEALLKGNLAPTLLDAGRRDDARRTLREAIAARREIGDHYGLSHSLVQLGDMALEEGEPLTAQRYFEEARDASPGNAAFGAAAACGLALAASDAGRPRSALTHALAALRLTRSIGSPIGTADALDALAAIDARGGEHARALRFARAAELLRNGRVELPERVVAMRERRIAAVRTTLPAPDVDVASVIIEAEQLRSPTAAGARKPQLTTREREVASLIASGSSNREIASRLGIGVRTVESHVERIRRKADARSRAQLAALIGRDLIAPQIP
jgi:DNA-binding CsgD family transcriptional regulator/transcriptional regulator with XRE-family HTH domain